MTLTTDETSELVVIAPPPHAPIACLGGPYFAEAGIPVTLDGSCSFDIDPTDQITEYQWDFDHDDEPDRYTAGSAVTWAFPIPGLTFVGLRVADQGVFNGGQRLFSAWSYAEVIVTDAQRPVIVRVESGGAEASGEWTLWWSSVSGRYYRAHQLGNLSETNWEPLPGDVMATSNITTKTDTTAVTNRVRFYRIQVLP